MKYLLLTALLTGCMAPWESSMDWLKDQKINCEKFQVQLKELNVKKTTDSIEAMKSHCTEYGFWKND